jgi:hypothetical protein
MNEPAIEGFWRELGSAEDCRISRALTFPTILRAILAIIHHSVTETLGFVQRYMTGVSELRCKAFALKINPCGLHANYKHRSAGIALVKNVKDCQITAAIALGQVGQNLAG